MQTPAFFAPITQQAEPSAFIDPSSLPSEANGSESQTNSAEALSPSQVRCFMDCQMRWWFKYGLKVPDPATANMALGRAVHSSLGENFAQKVRSVLDERSTGVVSR